MDAGITTPICVGIVTVGAGGASVIKTLCTKTPCDLHRGIDDSQKLLFKKIDDLQKEVGNLPFKILELIRKEK